ncbi:MAG: hypothetical protein C4524_12375 [Candidatus Zixiibacteriota bacterium]|nr:MAG: hypothetical protein C4524_12375 [candidate division Zixibacteria bacterium]
MASSAQDVNIREDRDRQMDSLVINFQHLEDAWLNADSTGRELNYGAHDGALAGKAPQGCTYLLRLLDLPQLLGPDKVILGCRLYVFISHGDGMSGNKTVGALRVFKPWVAGTLDGQNPGQSEGCTFNDWSADSLEWALPGGHYQNDTGTDNTGDGEGADCMQTPESLVLIPQTAAYPWVTPGYRVWEISPGLVQGWYQGTIANNGLALKTVYPWGWAHIRSEEYADHTKRPYFVVTYLTSSPVTPDTTRLRVLD